MRTTLSVILTAAVLACFAQVAQAATIDIAITNADFSSPVLDPGARVDINNATYNAGGYGWTPEAGYSAIIDYRTWGNPGPFAPLGNFLVVDLENPAGVRQVTGATYVAGATYTLSLDIVDTDNWSENNRLALRNGNDHSVVSSADYTVNIPGTTWASESLVYTATAADAGKPIEVYMAGLGTKMGFDNVSLTSSTSDVPEPGTLVMLAAGLFGLLAYAWRKRK